LKTTTLFLALVSALGITTAPGQTLNLTHRYSFNGNANDLAGTANGTLQGGAIISNNALVLDGVNSYLALPANIVTNYTAITLEAWVTDNGSGAWARIFDFGNNTSDYMFLALPAGGGNLRGAYTISGNGAEQVLQWPGGRPAVGQESHVVWTTDSATQLGLLYVNGVPVGTNAAMTLTPAALGPTVNNWLGRSQFSPDAWFNGAIDEFRIYNAALSSNAVYQDYLLGPDTLGAGPVYFLAQPQSQTVVQARSVTFSAVVGGQPPFFLQWYRNNAPIGGATNQTLTFTAALTDSNANYRLWATNTYTNTVFIAASSNAVLTVTADTVPPVLLSARSVSTTTIQLVFSKPLSAATATNLANYVMSGPGGLVSISAAVLDSTGTNVTLTIPPLVFGASYTVTVNGVTDLVGNVIAPGSQASVIYVPNSITVQADQPGVTISSNLFGIFFEELSSAGDGGLYAELVRNRSFKDNTNADYWSLLTSGTASGTMALDTSLPMSPSNLTSLRLTLAGGVGTVGAANSGYWGIPVSSGAQYNLGFYARCSSGFNTAVTASLESSSGAAVYASSAVTGLTTGWSHFTTQFTPNSSDPAARLVLRISQPGTVWLDFVSLFPAQTFHNRSNGLRPDLANMLVNLRPSFVRFPGGAWVDGSGVADFYNWEVTVGDPANRQPRWDLWGYMVDNGLGYHEYLQMCEDLGAVPLFAVNCGMDYSIAVATNQLGPYIQEALDGIEYANGDTNSFWGAQRAANGHPAPFNLQYMEIGNENGGGDYNTHYAMFYDAIKAQYPQMKLIATSSVSSRPMDVVDEHFYPDPTFFEQQSTRYDSYSRTGPKVFVGEYAVTSGSGNGNLAGALGEAAFMTGMERNSDVVIMASYAPLFANLNNKDWNPDLIYFTGTQVYGTPSYYVQQMFSLNRGDVVLPTAVVAPATASTNHGAIGLGTWNTQSAYCNLITTAGSTLLYESDFTTPAGTNGWQFGTGTWVTTNGLFEQTAGGTDNTATYGSTTWSNYTYTLRAMKLSGSEGFLIMFNVLDSNNYMWWNIGGWGNTQTGIEWAQNGAKSLLASVPMTINTNQWYDIAIELSDHIRCYLDGVLIHDVSNVPVALYASSSYLHPNGQIIVKAVNATGSPVTTELRLNAARGLAPNAAVTVLTSASPLDENSLAQSNHVAPVAAGLTGVSADFAYTFPANSLTVLRLQEQPDSPVGVSLNTASNQLALTNLSNGIPVTLSSFITNAVSVKYTVDGPGGVVARGTLAFAPGDLGKVILLSIPNLPGYNILRLTLSSPVNGQLRGITQAYYVNLPGAGGAPLLGLAQFPDQTVLYWSDATSALQRAGNLPGLWTTLSNLPSPAIITLTNAQQYFRLERPH
jgi:alpha-L-arabinofuranosidase